MQAPPPRTAGKAPPAGRRAPPAARAALAVLLLAPSGGAPAPARDEPHPPRPAQGAEKYDAPTRRWREGPVRYLLTKEEDKAYRALKRAGEEKRRRFIEEFWNNRDPDPATPGNEFRDLFYRRVAEADRMFNESTVPGWKTDRGKIHVLLGPPDEIEWLRSPRSERQAVLWTYRMTAGLEGLGPNPTLRFVRDPSGEYRLTNRLLLSAVETPLGVEFQSQAMLMRGIVDPRAPIDLDAIATVPPGAAPFRTHRDFFRSPDGRTLALLTVGIREDLLDAARRERGSSGGGPAGARSGGGAGPAEPARPRFEVSARLVGEQPGLPTYELAGPDRLRCEDAPGGDRRIYQGGMPVVPGRYSAHYEVADLRTGLAYTLTERVDVPAFRGAGLALSSITLAGRLERLPQGGAGYSAPFALGTVKVIPRPGDIFHAGEDLAIYYHVYGSEIDPIEGRPDFDVEYRFFVREEDAPGGGDRFAPLGQPIRLTGRKNPVQGFSLPLSQWRRALYRLRVTVTDNLSGRRTSREAAFRVD
ncbi:MAG: GWxTD domain-containing protein [Acidobacteriota bacterium]